jgi:hypothetical protein
MKSTITKYGVYGGLCSAFFLSVSSYLQYNLSLNNGLIYGYFGMLISLSFVVAGIYKKRAESNANWRYGKAFAGGMVMVFITSLIYVITWQIIYYAFIPDFADKYAKTVIAQLKQKGLTGEELQKQIDGMEKFKENYRNPLFNAGMTFSEIFPVGFVVVLFTSLFLRKPKN